MEVKKTKKADLEGQKSTSLLIGLVVGFATMLAAFEWTTHEYEDKSETFKASSNLMDEEDIVPITQQVFLNTPPPPADAPQVAEILEIVDDNTDIEETKIETSEDLNVATTGPSAPSANFSMAPPAVTQEETGEDEVFEISDVEPEFPGGSAALMAWLAKNLKYPASAQETGIQGRVLVSFVVNKDGAIVEPKVTRSVDPSLDKESVRVVSSMPRWRPGKNNGRPVRVKYTLPVTFRLQ